MADQATTTTADATKTADATAAAAATDTTKTTQTVVDKTLVGGGGKTDATATTTTTTVAAPTWRDDWRETMAAGDAKELERLKRFNDPSMVYKSFRAMEQKMSTGELKTQLPAEATPEQVAEYRKSNGIPDTPDGYLKDLPTGLIVGEEDKALFSDFAKTMHDANAAPKDVQAALGWYYKFNEKLQAEDQKKAADFRRQAEDTLRADWGKDYHENLERAGEVISLAPEDVRNQIQNARLPDGTIAGDHPGIAKWLATISRELNPARTLAPAGGAAAFGSVNDEIASIEKDIRENRAAYFRDDAKQERYRTLLAHRDKLAASGRAA